MQKIAVSISIVHYKNYSLTRSLLKSIYRFKPKCSFEVIVVNNDEKELIKNKITREFPQVKYIKSDENRGYSAGNNLAFKSAKGKYFLVLNPDTLVTESTIDTLFEFLESHQKVALVAPQLKNQEGEVYHQLGAHTLTPVRGIFVLSFLNKIFPENPVSKQYEVSQSDNSKTMYVDAVPGSAFMIRSEIFRKIGMYDERFFLYFEESDLGKRLRDKGYKIAIIPTAQVIHFWGETTKGSERAERAFKESRFLYFKKHYGLLNALIVELFARFSKWWALILLVTIASFFLRFINFSQHMTFHGELGDNYLVARELFENRQIPLIGPPTSHPWLSFGPLFYWIIIPVLAIVRFNPLYANGFIILLHSFLPLLAYVSTHKFIGKKAALLQAFLIAISPLTLSFSREARFFSLTLIVFYPFLYTLLSERYLFAGLLFSILLNFHLTPVILIPVLLLYFYRKGRKEIKVFLLGALIPQTPFLTYCLLFDRDQLIRLIVWFPYRILGFLGIVHENTVNTQVIQGNSNSFIHFLSSPFSMQTAPLLTLFVSTIVVYYFITRKTSFSRFIKFSFVAGLAGIFIHGNPPEHYYLPLIPSLFVMIADVLSRLPRLLTLAMVMFVIILNIPFYMGEDTRFQNGLVPYDVQLKIARNIVADSQGKSFWIKREGPFSEFTDNYAQNYLYLVWYLGQKPVRNSKHIFTIHDEGMNTWYEKNF